ncbi:MAG: DNA-binding protein WhiA [Senegalia sp. (in: firmicutes)]|uniref:DNA-binding protein WhiA n=1 Tax=Senegalia sp. (in: firmicutes) TaxID=1924098 RepID=UPI003F974F69
MSFSSQAKSRLSRLEIKNDCCPKAELSALIRMSGTIQLVGRGNINIKFQTENAAIARRVFSLIKRLYDSQIEVMVRKNKQLKKNNSYLMIIHDKKSVDSIIKDTGLFNEEEKSLLNINYKVPRNLIKKKCCRRAYIRGSFLGGGSLSDPEKTYHLEFVTQNKDHAKDLSQIINSFKLNSKIVIRKDYYVVYLKEGEQIVDLLNIIEAHTSLLELENIRVVKGIRNNINRIVNCETANLSKTINASVRQVENIKYIENTIGIEKLPKNLQELANIRLYNKEASLKELGNMLSIPLGKSGVNHRLRKIESIAENLKEKERS